MTKLLQNKSIIKFLGIALSILLIVALIPQISIAYGSKDDVVSEDNPVVETDTGEDTTLADTGEEPTTEGEQPTDEVQPAEGDEAENAPALQADEPAVAPASEETSKPVKARAAKEGTKTQGLRNDISQTIDGDVTNSNGVLVFDRSETKEGGCVLTVNGTLRSDIKVEKGAELTIKGTGTIIGAGSGSVITVEGTNSKLIFEGPTVTGGTGTEYAGQENKRVGGGIFVKRSDHQDTKTNSAALWLKKGKIYNNKAHAGGGIYVDYRCGFTMTGGVVTGNFAKEIEENDGKASEGGGIFISAAHDYEFNDKAKILGGSITNNTSETTFAWGGGGVFVNNPAIVQINSALITKNCAWGLGGGVSGCPHARVAVGASNYDKGVQAVANGAAILGNSAQSGFTEEGAKFERAELNYPSNMRLRFLDTESVVNEQTGRVAAGDFLFAGLSDGQVSPNGWPIGRWSGGGGSLVAGSSVFAENGNYAKRADIKDLANDFYCIRASFIDATDLGNHPGGIAWRGYTAWVPTVAAEKKISSQPTAEVVEIPVNESYSALNASLGLTNTATEDKYAESRSVLISGNESHTHGGGVACNGILEFGTFSSNKIVDSYSISLKKEIKNDQGTKVDIAKGETFSFELTEAEKKSDGTYEKKKGGKTYTAKSDSEGRIEFAGLPGYEEAGAHEAYFILHEIAKEGYATLPDLNVEVSVSVARSTTNETAGAVTTNLEEYKVVEKNVTLTTQESQESINNGIVTNTLLLKGEEILEVQKNTDSIGGGSFDFQVQEVSVPKNVNESESELELPGEAKVDSLAAVGSASSLKVENIKEQQDSKGEGIANLKLEYTEPGTHWYRVSEAAGDETTVSGTEVDYDKTVYLVRVDVKESDDARSLETVKTTWKANNASASKLEKVKNDEKVSFTNVAVKYEGFELGLNKQILTTLNEKLTLNGRTFDFALYDAAHEEVANGTTDKNGKLTLKVDDGNYAKQAYRSNTNEEQEFTFTLKESVPKDSEDSFMATIPEAEVTVKISASGKRITDGDHEVFLVTPSVDEVTVTVDGKVISDIAVADKNITVTNRYTPNGTWQFTADKFFYGAKPTGCKFTMVELEDAPAADQPLKDVKVKEGEPWKAKVDATDFDEDGKAVIKFDAVIYKAGGMDEAEQTHFYLITEDGDAGAKDTTAYVVKVKVAVDKDDPGKLIATEKILGYADDMDSPLNESSERVAFYNTDTFGLISAANYSVYAASGEPVDQVCYVDPKIYKNLEGRAIKSGEFAFKLIEVANYDDTEGTVISATTNDEFGMVDFDKANNVSGDLENPSCLAYTKPGTYYYRVIEDTSKGGMNDQSVLYSDQVITFTTVIEQNEQTGQLECTDMYYGYWDKEAGKNVRFDEQYVDYDTTPANIGDMAKLNPDWHPTITNKTRPMDLQVRKTSVTDRNEGLVGATYALYMVNENAQGDIKLAEATSEEGGWITYKNVSLSTNNLYYFKETAAPAGHTVSEFRSSYFSLVEDAESANGYTLKYTDSKFLPETGAEASQPEAQTLALTDETVEAQAKNAPAGEAATEPAAEATDDQTQPGHSADGNILLTYDKDGGVADEATELSVSKLDTRTHEWVEGAELVILEKDSGKEIASWTSGKAPQKLEKTLNVGTTYLLREVKAPDNYKLAEDVEFVIDSYGNVSVTKGTENGNAELSDNTINLYDTMMDAEEVEKKEREKTREVPKDGGWLAQTGDMLPLLGIALVAIVALVVLLAAMRRRRSDEKDRTQN